MGRRVLGKMVPVWAALFRLLKKKAPRSLPSIEITPNIVMRAMRCGVLQTESLRYADNYLIRQPKALLPGCTSRPHTDSFRVHHVVNQEALNESDPCADAPNLHIASSTTAGRSSLDSEEHYSTAASSLGTPAEGDSSCRSSPSRASATSYASDGLEVYYCDAASNSRHDQRDCTKEQEEEEAVVAATATATAMASCNRGSTCVASRSCSSRPRHGNELCRSFEAPVAASIDEPAKPSMAIRRRVGGTAPNSSKPTPITIKKARNDCKPKPHSTCSSALNRKQMQNGSRSHGADHMAVVQYSEDPLSDFSSSIVHMVVSHQMREQQDLEDLFLRYLRLNAPEHHRTIALAFLHAMERLGSFEQHLGTTSQSQNSSYAPIH